MELRDFFPIWHKLTAVERETLTASVRPVHFDAGQRIHDGDDCMGLILVISGRLRAYAVSPDGREITLYRLLERNICLFSASCIMRSIQFEITISAERDTEAILVSPEVYRQIMEQSAVLANYTNEVMAARFTDVMWLIEQVMWKSFDKRLAEFLLNEMTVEGSEVLQMTHEVIGNHIGSPREVVTRMLRYFQEEGMVQLSRGKVEITDSRRLAAVCG